MSVTDRIKKLEEYADQDCICDDSLEDVECDNPKVHIARSALNEAGEVAYKGLRDIEALTP